MILSDCACLTYPVIQLISHPQYAVIKKMRMVQNGSSNDRTLLVLHLVDQGSNTTTDEASDFLSILDPHDWRATNADSWGRARQDEGARGECRALRKMNDNAARLVRFTSCRLINSLGDCKHHGGTGSILEDSSINRRLQIHLVRVG